MLGNICVCPLDLAAAAAAESRTAAWNAKLADRRPRMVLPSPSAAIDRTGGGGRSRTRSGRLVSHFAAGVVDPCHERYNAAAPRHMGLPGTERFVGRVVKLRSCRGAVRGYSTVKKAVHSGQGHSLDAAAVRRSSGDHTHIHRHRNEIDVCRFFF